MSFIGNILWIVLGGLLVAVEYLIGGLLLCCTIVGIPFGLQVIKMGSLALWPFGRDTIVTDQPRGCLSTVMNLFWLIFGGIEIALTHLVLGLLLCITIIGIPFGKQHFKLMTLALTPFGREIR